MASSCYGRRLSELLQEQQEPFLLHGGGATDAAPCCCGAEACRRRRRLLGWLCVHIPVHFKNSNGVGRSAWGRAMRRALQRWDLAGCFPCGAAPESFWRLPRAGDTAGVHRDVVTEFDGARRGRQLSPVSVLDVLHSDEETSPMFSNWEDDDDETSTSGSSPSPPSGQDLTGATSRCFTFYDADEKDPKATRTGEKSMEEEHSMIISSWERIAGDISKIPVLVELDLAGSAREWRRRLVEEEEASRVGVSIAAMIFEEIRAEAVRDMLCLPEPCWLVPTVN